MKCKRLIWSSAACLVLTFAGCSTEPDNNSKLILSKEFQDYWYDGNAEISSYQLNQERYGEMRQGSAVMIFVTEHFSIDSQTKADNPSLDDPGILKMNFTKNFRTGIYPYSIMLSTFFPLEENAHSLKVTASTQEWCGQTYMELNQKDNYDLQINSYYEGESKENFQLDVVHLEDDIWTAIRTEPFNLPTGELNMIPSFTYLRLMHIETKAYPCEASLSSREENMVYRVNFEQLKRDVEIEFEAAFPYRIVAWRESYPCGKCEEGEALISSGKLIETIKVDYWNKNGSTDTLGRYQLGLH